MSKRNAAFGSALLAALAAGILSIVFETARAAAAGDPPYDERVARLVTEASFPGSGAVILLDRRTHVWSFDETIIERVRAVKILTDEGIDRFGDFVSDGFAKEIADYQVEATVVSPRGDRTQVDRDRFRKIEIGRTGFQYRAALPGLEIGSIIEIAETFRTELAITWGEWDFSERVTTLRSELIFKVPIETLVAFTYTPRGASVAASVAREGKYDVHTLRAEMVQPYTDEIYMPRNNVGNPTVHYRVRQVTMKEYLRFFRIEFDARLAQYIKDSGIPWELPLAAKNWRDIADAYSRYFDAETWKDADGADRRRSALRSMMEALPARDSLGIVGEIDGVIAAFHRQYQPAARQFYYRNPERSVDLREGDAFESAYVLKRMLALRDIESTVVLASDLDYGLLDERNPDPRFLNHPLLLVEWHGAKHWIDPATPQCRVDQIPWECQGVRAMKLEGGEAYAFVTTPLDAAAANLVAREIDAAVDGAGRLAGRARVRLVGQPLLEMRRRIRGETPDPDDEEFRAFIGGLLPDGFETDSVSVETDRRDTVVVRCRIAARDFGVRAGDILGIELAGWFDDSELEAFAAESRRLEIVFPFPVSRSLSLRIAVPHGCVVETLPKFASRTSEFFSYKRSCREDGGAVLLRRTSSITAPSIRPEEYAEAKREIDAIRKYDRESIVLKRGL